MVRYIDLRRLTQLHCFLAISQGTPTVQDIKNYLTRLRRLLSIMSRYQDTKTMEEFQAQQKTLEAMLAAAENDETQKDAIDSKYFVLITRDYINLHIYT